MLLSRWKLMAGVLGVSLGGLAAVAGQCPKNDTKTSTRRQAEPPEAEVPLLPSVPSGGTPTAKAPELPPAPALPPAPGGVELPAPPATSELPALPPAPSAPAVPAKEPMKAPELPPAPAASMPPAPPAPSTEPALPPAPPVVPASGTETKPASSKPEPASKPEPVPVTKPAPAGTAPDFPVTTFVTPATKAVPPAADPVIEPKPEPKPEVKPVAAATASAPAAAAASKYRILLRVGEGEPTFEVKCGDDLVLKVVCEKIDIKSPEKGSGPSAVKASGKVRFVGFGAEGTCEELAFLAGTGEVTLAGAVKIQVKDKLGRIESELSTETMKYRIDPSAAFSGGKP